MRHYYWKNKNSLILFGIVNIIAAASSVFLSYLLGIFTDCASSGAYDYIWWLLGGTAAYIAVDTILNFLLEYTRGRSVSRIGRDLRQELVQTIERLPFSEKVKKEESDYVSLLNNDIPTIENEYLDSIGAIYFQICCFIIALVSAVLIQPIMAGIVLLLSLVTILFPKLFEKELQRTKESEQQAKASYLAVIAQVLNGFSLLKLHDGFYRFNGNHDRENDNLCKSKIRFCKTRSALYAASFGCGTLVFLGTWIIGLFFMRREFISLPELITFSHLMTFFAGPIQIISERYSSTIAANAVCKRILSFVKRSAKDAEHWGTAPLSEFNEVDLTKVNIDANGKVLLHDLNITLKKGDRVALLGESGSGKSSLLKFMAEMYHGTGSYLINGIPHTAYAYSDFRKQVSFLEQNSFIFNATIRDNLTMFGTNNLDDEQLNEVIATTGLAPWYASRGGSLDTKIGMEKAALSGGEARRFTLARALAHHGALVLLDEPTSALDAESRKLVERTISHMECDILVAAVHEYSSEFLQSFNRVFVVKNGGICEQT